MLSCPIDHVKVQRPHLLGAILEQIIFQNVARAKSPLCAIYLSFLIVTCAVLCVLLDPSYRLKFDTGIW
jgi:hypothetical protein